MLHWDIFSLIILIFIYVHIYVYTYICVYMYIYTHTQTFFILSLQHIKRMLIHGQFSANREVKEKQ